MQVTKQPVVVLGNVRAIVSGRAVHACVRVVVFATAMLLLQPLAFASFDASLTASSLVGFSNQTGTATITVTQDDPTRTILVSRDWTGPCGGFSGPLGGTFIGKYRCNSVSAPTSSTLTLTDMATGEKKTFNVMVLPNQVSASVSPGSIVGGQGPTAVLTITLDAPLPDDSGGIFYVAVSPIIFYNEIYVYLGANDQTGSSPTTFPVVGAPVALTFTPTYNPKDSGHLVVVPATPQLGGSGGSCPCVGAPINLSSGNTYIQQTDLTLPGINGGLQLSRTWNSLLPVGRPQTIFGAFGHGWSSNYEERAALADGGNQILQYVRGDGSLWRFVYQGIDAGVSSYKLADPSDQLATAQIDTVTGKATIIFHSGEKRGFLSSGALSYLQDRNGNTTNLTYDSVGRLTVVSDPAQRKFYFDYEDARFPSQATNLYSESGTGVAYLYDRSGRLDTVTYADGATTHFHYDASSLITSVTDSEGVILESHTYDSFRRGLSSARAGGVDSLTINY